MCVSPFTQAQTQAHTHPHTHTHTHPHTHPHTHTHTNNHIHTPTQTHMLAHAIHFPPAIHHPNPSPFQAGPNNVGHNSAVLVVVLALRISGAAAPTCWPRHQSKGRMCNRWRRPGHLYLTGPPALSSDSAVQTQNPKTQNTKSYTKTNYTPKHAHTRLGSFLAVSIPCLVCDLVPLWFLHGAISSSFFLFSFFLCCSSLSGAASWLHCVLMSLSVRTCSFFFFLLVWFDLPGFVS